MTPEPETPYRGEAGEAYFAYQNPHGEKRGRLNRRKFTGRVRPSDRVLDFGCGGGWLLAALDCAEKTGVEINPAAHCTCRANGVEVVERLEALGERRFDVVLSHHSLEHLENPLGTLRALREHLEPGGRLLLAVPIDDWRSHRRARDDDPNHHLYTWTPQLLYNLLQTAGYRNIRVRLYCRAWFPGWHRVIDRMPARLFDCCCAVWSRVFRSRELIAEASP